MITMKYSKFLTVLLCLCSFHSNAQLDLSIIYDATQGVSGLVGASKVYMQSGANDMPGPLDGSTWSYVVGNWGLDDGVGELVPLGNDRWAISIDPLLFYSLAPTGPVIGSSIARIGMIFRDETGMLTGRDDNDDVIYLDLTSNPPAVFNANGTPFAGVAAATSPVSVNAIFDEQMEVVNSPNPLTKSTVFSYKINSATDVSIHIFDTQGRMVNTVINENQSAGVHHVAWNGDDFLGKPLASGIYTYSLFSGTRCANGKLVIVR